MTGPPYPRYAPGQAPNENAIGDFIIGASPIGTIAPFDAWATIISQYANSPILTRLITDFAGYVDQTVNFDNFFDMIMNIDTAQGYGLDVWGRIVGVTRAIAVPNSDVYLGFEESTDAEAFNQAPFFSGSQLNNTFYLSDTSFRTLIFAKALANISDGSIPSINHLLLALFPNRGNCYVVDNLDMTLTYNFVFPLSAVERAIVEQADALPKPTGVAVFIASP